MSTRIVAHKWVWYFAAITGTFIMATLGVFVRHITPGNEFVIALGRFSIGFVCLVGLRTLTSQKSRNDPPALPIRITWGLAASGFFLALFVACYFKAVQTGTMAIAAFLLYLGPLVASVLAAVWLGERFSRLSGVLLGCALLGTLFITEFRLPEDSAQIEGLVYGVLSGVFYGLFLLFNNSKIQRGGSSVARTSYQFLFASGVMVPFVAVNGIALTPTDILWIIAVGVLHGFLALTLVIAALGRLKTIEYGTISYGEPVMASLLGVALYDEYISLLQMVGCLFVLVAGLTRVLIKEKAHHVQKPI